MKRRQTLLISFLFLIVGALVLSSATGGSRGLCEAPMIGGGHAGGPMEYNCVTAGCHTGGINNGPGLTTLDIDGDTAHYIPGHKYLVTVHMAQDSIDEFGFQTEVLRDADSVSVGTFTLIDTNRTRLIHGPWGRIYIAVTSCGADAIPPDSITWTFWWKAPSADSGALTFYINTIACNHDHTPDGDNTYVRQMHLTPALNTGIDETSDNSFHMTQLGMSSIYRIETPYGGRVSLFDISGRFVADLTGQPTVDMTQYHLSDGVYFCRYSSDTYSAVRKIHVLARP